MENRLWRKRRLDKHRRVARTHARTPLRRIEPRRFLLCGAFVRTCAFPINSAGVSLARRVHVAATKSGGVIDNTWALGSSAV